MRTLCRLEDIPDGGSRGFPAPPGGFTGLFAIRRGAIAYVYVNACPHVGVTMDWTPGDFLSRDKKQIICSNHGALFVIETGLCTTGPCKGDRLEPVLATVENGLLLVPEDAGL